jgi:hypothetical protein
MESTRKTLKPAAKLPADGVAPVELPVVMAFKALKAGTAEAHQQQLALEWLIFQACAKGNFAYHPTDRDTAFALGRQFVADQIVGLIDADITPLTGPRENA